MGPKVPDGITLKDFYAGTAMLGMLSFGDTKNRDPEYIAEKSAAIADAMIARLSAGPWRPIATAPKDGTAFVAWSPTHGVHGNVSWGRFQRFDPDGYSSLMSDWTHWMPIPSAPRPTA